MFSLGLVSGTPQSPSSLSLGIGSRPTVIGTSKIGWNPPRMGGGCGLFGTRLAWAGLACGSGSPGSTVSTSNLSSWSLGWSRAPWVSWLLFTRTLLSSGLHRYAVVVGSRTRPLITRSVVLLWISMWPINVVSVPFLSLVCFQGSVTRLVGIFLTLSCRWIASKGAWILLLTYSMLLGTLGKTGVVLGEDWPRVVVW